MFVRNAWYVAGWSSEFGPGQITARTLLEEPIAFYRKRSGEVVALEDRCVHRHAPLSLGQCEGDDLRCMYHGLKFAPSGQCVEIPGFKGEIPAQARVRSFPVVERHSWVWVWPGNPELADANLIPRAIGLEDPAWVLRTGQLDYDASHELINDNLLDFSHLSYVHRRSFQADEQWAHKLPKITVLERGVRVERWLESATGFRSQAPRDVWSYYDFMVPGILLLGSRAYPPGTAAASNGGPPGDAVACDLASETFSCQAVTPVTPKTSRYFFSWGPRAGDGAPALADMLIGVAHQAFAEDKLIIEAQQKVRDRSPGVNVMPTPSDRAVMAFQRLIKRLVDAETASHAA